MNYLSMIFFQIVAPILVLLGVGVGLQKKFNFNLKAMSQLITYCFMPIAVFLNIYETSIQMSVLGHVALFICLFIWKSDAFKSFYSEIIEVKPNGVSRI